MKASLLNLVESQVSKFRQMTGLSDSEAVNLKSLLLKLNVLTLYRPLSKDFSGMSLKSGDRRFIIFLSTRIPCHTTVQLRVKKVMLSNAPMLLPLCFLCRRTECDR